MSRVVLDKQQARLAGRIVFRVLSVHPKGMYVVGDKAKTLGQQYWEAAEALKAEGMANAQAVRAVAERLGKNANTVRAGIFQFRSTHPSGATNTGRRVRRSANATVEDHLASARRSLEEALSLIDLDVQQAKAALDAAQARYDAAVATAKDKKADIEPKLKALA